MQSSQAPPSFQPPRYTYNDYKNWTEDWELIYGYAFSLLPAANRIHQAAIIKFSTLIGDVLDKKIVAATLLIGLIGL